jgi:hypothetical protein
MDPLTPATGEPAGSPSSGKRAPNGLEEFLRSEAARTKAHIAEVQRLVDEVLEVFTAFSSDRTWPYELVNAERPAPSRDYSFSTAAMIAFALRMAAGRIHDSVLVPAVKPTWASSGDRGEKSSVETRARGDDLARDALDRLISETGFRDNPNEPPNLSSTTFGPDDPFTLTWLLEALPREETDWAGFRNAVERKAWQRVRAFLKAPEKESGLVLQIRRHELVSHSFPILRMLQLGEALSRADKGPALSRRHDVSAVREYLFKRVHMQLSESEMPESAFDAGDLMFALEGWLLTSPAEPPLALVARSFEVLKKSQRRTPYWRPLRPFKVSPQGLVLLPQSVEIANSLLRLCNLPVLEREGYFSRNVDLLERYARWLLGRVFRGATKGPGGKQFVGWESEHTYTLDRIHLWQTSQVLIFLQHYVALLQQYVARTSLELAGFILPTGRIGKKTLAEHERRWATWIASEPLSGRVPSESPYLVYERIDADFVRPRRPETPGDPSTSMLLYGPPGTGKSTIAKELAAALGFPMITVTPSDFVAAGGEAVEARAKAIFQMLETQSDLVVLFDEIDQLLLDRDSSFYRAQGDVFKLLTPGMLTKLADLADRGRVVFVVSTNYYERIDRAIKRPGRIDARLLVLPPNRAQRTAFLGRNVERWKSISDSGRDAVARETLYFTYRELKDLADHMSRRHHTTGKALERALRGAVAARPPLITLESYGSRLDLREIDQTAAKPGTDEQPWEEFAMLAYLGLDTTDALPTRPPWAAEALALALRRNAIVHESVADELRALLPQRAQALLDENGASG